MYFFFFLG